MVSERFEIVGGPARGMFSLSRGSRNRQNTEERIPVVLTLEDGRSIKILVTELEEKGRKRLSFRGRLVSMGHSSKAVPFLGPVSGCYDYKKKKGHAQLNS